MRASWARDEVILGLDFLIFHNFRGLTQSNPGIIELSNLLRRLPIINPNERDITFRNPVGVSSTLRNFWTSFSNPDQKFKPGSLFYSIYIEYKGKVEELHKIALAIRRCEKYISPNQYGDVIETEGFPEGAILSHLHRNAEARFTDTCKEPMIQCEVCGLHPTAVYSDMKVNRFLGKHLLVAPADFDPDVALTDADFMTVCPNCHQALHILRPWRGRKDCDSILLT